MTGTGSLTLTIFSTTSRVRHVRNLTNSLAKSRCAIQWSIRTGGTTKVQALAAGPPDVVAEKLRGYVAAGARHLVVRIATTSLESQREQLEHIIKLKGYL